MTHCSESLEAQYRKPQQDRDRFFNILVQDTDRLGRLVDRLMDLAKAEVIKPGTETTQVNPVLTAIAGRYNETSVSIELHNHPSVQNINMAPETFESIITNLVDNSLKHGGKNVKLKIRTVTVESEDGKFVEIIVKDDGPCISQANADKIFGPFFTTAADKGGTGLGLSIVQALVSAHGGSISLDHVYSGTQFTIRVPSQ